MSKEGLLETGRQIFMSQPRCPGELLALTYGAYVAKLLREADDNDPEIVNAKLEKLGYGMGFRMADEFFSR